ALVRERMLPPFAMTKLIGHQHQAPLPGPGHAHVLQLALRLRIVMAVNDQDARPGLHRFFGPIQVGGDKQARPTFENEVLDHKALVRFPAGDANFQILGHRRELPERITQRFETFIPVTLPILFGFDVLPELGFAAVDGIATGANFLADHLPQCLGLVTFRGENVAIKLADHLGKVVVRANARGTGKSQYESRQECQSFPIHWSAHSSFTFSVRVGFLDRKTQAKISRGSAATSSLNKTIRMSTNAKRIVLTTFGSLGDLHPYVAVALGLKARGHDVILATSEYYRTKIQALGIGFHAVRPDMPDFDANPGLAARLMDLRKGTERILLELVFPALRDSYDDLLGAARGADL